MTHHAHTGHAHHAHDGDSDDSALAEMLDLNGPVLRDYWTDVLTWLRRAARHLPRQRILDIGAGTGVGTIALAQRFAGAEVTAVDNSEPMLDRIRAKALELGLAPRVRAVRADLDAGLPESEPLDLSWASLSLHHLADPDRLLAQVREATRPGGLIAVAEFGEPQRFLPHDVGFGRPGLEDRLMAALAELHAEQLPELGTDWPPRLAAAGFTILEHRTFEIDVRPGPDPRRRADAVRYAELWFGRMRPALADSLDADDRAALDRLLDGDGEQSLRHGVDLHLHGTRTVTLARRP